MLRWPTGSARARLPMSLTASVVIHVVLLTILAFLLRAMPATISHDVLPATIFSADIISLPAIDVSMFVPLPSIDAEPMEMMIPPPMVTLARSTPLQGASATPASIQILAEFAPVGRISYGISDGKRLFGPDLAAQMRNDYPDLPARTPRLDGTLSVMYPVKAAVKGQSLVLTALITIDERGAIAAARVLPDEPAFVAAVLEALKAARFQPAQFAGKPIPYWVVLDFNFAIDGPTGPDGKRLDR